MSGIALCAYELCLHPTDTPHNSVPQREFFLSPSGLGARIVAEGDSPTPNRDARDYWFDVTTSAGRNDRVGVRIVASALHDTLLQQHGLGRLANYMPRFLHVVVIRNLDALETLPVDEYANRIIDLEAEDSLSIIQAPRLQDRAIRRFIARRVYDEYSRKTLSSPVFVDQYDFQACSASDYDFVRNAQVLAEEGYLTIGSTTTNEIELRPTAKLIRDVERYGAAREDAVAERDYLGALSNYAAIEPHVEQLTMEYRRYSTATSPAELASVFRAVAPEVESIVKELLSAHGSLSAHANLGTAINDLRSRQIGDIGLWSQLSHIIKFSRDLEGHGTALSEPVLRIACENAFNLVPQLAALFPR